MTMTPQLPSKAVPAAPDNCNRNATIVNNAVDSRALLGNQGKVIIEHDSMRYELRLTRQGKLILTK